MGLSDLVINLAQQLLKEKLWATIKTSARENINFQHNLNYSTINIL